MVILLLVGGWACQHNGTEPELPVDGVATAVVQGSVRTASDTPVAATMEVTIRSAGFTYGPVPGGVTDADGFFMATIELPQSGDTDAFVTVRALPHSQTYMATTGEVFVQFSTNQSAQDTAFLGLIVRER